MKVLMILSNPFMVDPRVYKEAKTLIDVGHEVNILEWDRKKNYEPESIIEKIKIIRIHNTRFMDLLPHDLLRNPIWWIKAFQKGLHLYKTSFPFDAVHCHDLDTLLSGCLLKNRLKVKLIYDAHEIFGYMISRELPRYIVKLTFFFEKLLLRRVDKIITVSEPLKTYFQTKTNKPVTIVMNCKDIVNRSYQPPKNNVFTLCYIGVLHKSRMFPDIIDIVGNIKKVKMIIAGKKENLYEEVKKHCEQYDNIDFLGPIPYHDVIPRTLESDLVICMINPQDPNNSLGIANKQFEAMVCGRPIICTKDTYAGKLIEELKCGVLIDYTKESVEKAIITLRDNPELCTQLGKNALQAAITQYNWSKEKEKLINLYTSL